jgi:hypothetical protein
MNKKGLLTHPLLIVVLIMISFLGYLIISSSQTVQDFISTFGLYTLMVVIGLAVGIVTNFIKPFGGLLFNGLLLGIYWTFEMLAGSLGFGSHPIIQAMYSTVVICLISGYVFGTIIGKLIGA